MSFFPIFFCPFLFFVLKKVQWRSGDNDLAMGTLKRQWCGYVGERVPMCGCVCVCVCVCVYVCVWFVLLCVHLQPIFHSSHFCCARMQPEPGGSSAAILGVCMHGGGGA